MVVGKASAVRLDLSLRSPKEKTTLNNNIVQTSSMWCWQLSLLSMRKPISLTWVVLAGDCVAGQTILCVLSMFSGNLLFLNRLNRSTAVRSCSETPSISPALAPPPFIRMVSFSFNGSSYKLQKSLTSSWKSSGPSIEPWETTWSIDSSHDELSPTAGYHLHPIRRVGHQSWQNNTGLSVEVL